MSYTVSGHGHRRADYAALDGQRTDPGRRGQRDDRRDGIVDDKIVEGNETVIVTLTGTSRGSVTVAAAPTTRPR